MASPVRITRSTLADLLPAGGLTFAQGCASHSQVLRDEVETAGERLGAMAFTGIFVPGLNSGAWLPNDRSTVRTFFMTPELKAAGPSVIFLPLSYTDIVTELQTAKPRAALFSVSPPDDDGLCSFGPTADFLPDLWPSIPIRIAHINPDMPRTKGHRAIPFRDLTGFIEEPAALPTAMGPITDEVSSRIANWVRPFIPDGATLQTGLGKIPDAVLGSLTDHSNIKIHSGLIGEGVLELLEAGALAPGVSIRAGVAIGTNRLYDALALPEFEMSPVSITHNVRVLGGLEKFVAINSAMQVDLFGQAFAEMGPRGFASGPGGAIEFARGAKLAGGLRIVCLAADAVKGTLSRIVAPGEGMGPVSLGRMDTDIVVTEHGAADIRSLTHDARAQVLIGVASPAHRPALQARWDALNA